MSSWCYDYFVLKLFWIIDFVLGFCKYGNTTRQDSCPRVHFINFESLKFYSILIYTFWEDFFIKMKKKKKTFGKIQFCI